jgi:hypothetical protein
MKCCAAFLSLLLTCPVFAQEQLPKPGIKPLNTAIKHISTDKSVRYDYDIVYVRAKRAGDKVHKRYYTDFSQPVTMEPGADLMLLHPDGKEELLVAGGDGSITDPVVSFDAQWVYYVHLHNLQKHDQWSPPPEGADIYKLHLKSRKIVRLTNQQFTPNTGAGHWASDYRNASRKENDSVFNMGPCPLPGGRLAFTSNRDGFRPSKGYPAVALQLFVMDDRDSDVDANDPYPNNIEKIGHLNVAGALHPVALMDGRIMFSTLESQGIRSEILWGVWSIHPDGTRWGPLVSAFDPGGAPNGFHFQTQISDGSLVIEEYYNQNNSGFGAYIKMPPHGAEKDREEYLPAFGSANVRDPRNPAWRFGRFDNGNGKWYRMPFMPAGSVSLTPFALNGEGPADPADPKDKNSPRVGKFTHPSGAPDNHLLTVYSPGPVNHQYTFLPQLDGGIYLLKDGKPIEEPAELLLIKNDPEYNECWPRAVVPYRRIYGIAEPRNLPRLANDGSRSPLLPEGTPFGLVGSASLYKRESYPNGSVPAGKTTATYAGGNDPWKGLDPFTSHGNGPPINWHNQGADAGLYTNDDIHAIRILVQEPTTDRNRGPKSGRLFFNHASERMRILGEIPVRKILSPRETKLGLQSIDPDGNPDTSFLAQIPADTPFTFQTIDKRGMVLNMAQTWHQLRPGEIRTDCGGCHAHSQKPTDFSQTFAASHKVWDLVNERPLVTSAADDKSNKRWDARNETGLRVLKTGPLDVEYFRDIQPILKKSCVACHTGAKPAGNLNLDADGEKHGLEYRGSVPGTYYRLAADEKAKFGYKPVGWDSWGMMQASRYIRKLQSRRSLLVWKIYGERLDGFSNDDHPSESAPGKGDLVFKGQPVDTQKNRHRQDIDYTGSVMPPAEAVAGTYAGPDGKKIKVEPLTDEDRRTITRWIDLGCPIDQDEGRRERGEGRARSFGWFLDDNRPTLTLTTPQPGKNKELNRILIGMHDYGSGLDMATFRVTADFAINGVPAGENLASRFQHELQGIWELRLARPITRLAHGTVDVRVKDKQGNESRIVRTIAVGEEAAPETPRNLSHFVERGKFPTRVHVVEDYETDIEKRWWMRGTLETKDVPPGSRRCFRAALTKDFDDKMGNQQATYRAVIFNPVPGPPMGPNTRLAFRYKLTGSDRLRVQLYSLTNNYHRFLSLDKVPQGEWRSVAIDMTEMRRPDGSGGPLSENERIDDIQFYVDRQAELLIGDIVLYEPAAVGETRPFPKRILFTGWFDTGKQGQEWPGDFEIVPHEKPRTWKAARSVVNPADGNPGCASHSAARAASTP